MVEGGVRDHEVTHADDLEVAVDALAALFTTNSTEKITVAATENISFATDTLS